MGDAENALPPSKKRVAGRQLTKDDPDPDENAPETEMGTFKKASEEVMATRRIVRVRRSQPAPASTSNPFAGILLVAPVADSTVQTTKPVDSPATGGCIAPPGEPSDTENAVTDVGKENKTRDSSNKITDVEETSKPDDNEKSKPVEEKIQPEETSEVKNSDEKTDNVAVEEKTEGLQEQIEKKAIENKEEAVEEKTEDQQEQIAEEVTETKEKAAEKTIVDQQEQTEKKATETEEGGEKEKNAVIEHSEKEGENGQKDPAAPSAPLSSFQQLSSSQNAFSGLAGTGFSATSFSFGTFAKEGSTFGASSASPFAFKSENSSLFSFGAGNANGDASLPSLSAAPDASKSGKLSMQEVPVETGEENEDAVFTADAIMYEYLDGGWKERGKGELKLNVSVSDAEKARLVMRAKGIYRLVLNASLYPDMSLTNMDKRGITFACVNSAGEGKDGLTTVALKFKDSSIVQEFRESVMAHKPKKASASEPLEESTKESNE